jgi:hypothetical protein
MHLPGPFKLNRFGMGRDREKYDQTEAQERFEVALRGALKAPQKPLKEKPKTKKAAKKKPGKGRTSQE